MKPIKLFKVLSNETRLQILRWLRDPVRHFSSMLIEQKTNRVDLVNIGVSVSLIQQKSGMSQSTISQFLSMLQDVELVKATRIGQWTYYKRNEGKLAEIASYFANEL